MSLGDWEGSPRLAGDPHDDDGQVIDSFFLETDRPPDDMVAVQVPAIVPVKPPFRPTRLVTGSQTFPVNNTIGPMRLLPAQEDRLYLRIGTIEGDGVAVADVTYIADSNNALSNSLSPSSTAYVLQGKNAINFDAHTGEVWVRVINPGQSVTVTWAAVIP